MDPDYSSSKDRRRGLFRAAVFVTAALLTLGLGACGAPEIDPNTPITRIDQIAACWTDFDDPLKQVLCFSRGTDVVAVERGDGYGSIICNADGDAAILGNRLIVVQENVPAGCVDGTTFIGQFVECDLNTSTLLGMFCKRRLGDAVNDPTAGEQYILTRL